MKLTREQIQEIKKETYSRNFALNKGTIDEEARTVEIAFSSEDPYPRWFGIEILGHEVGEYDLEFLESGRAPLLDQHDHGKQRGVIEKAWVDKDRKGRAVVRFSRNAAADELFKDVIDEIKCNVSVGYEIKSMKLIESNEETGDVYRVTWAPFEASIVSVPADRTVGVGRSAEKEMILNANPKEKEKQMPEKGNLDPAKERAKIQAKFETDTREIMAIGEDHGFTEKAIEFISNGKSPEEFRNFVLAELKKQGMKTVETPDATIGLTEKEAQSFSIMRAINALANPANKRAQEAAAFEFEASRAVGEKLRKSPNGLFVPMDTMKRDLVAGTDTSGGHLVGTNLMSGSFIDMLTSRLILAKMGATILTGLVGDVAFPRQTGGAVAYWIGEGDDSTKSSATFDQVALMARTIAARTHMSRKLMLQSSLDVENLARLDLARSMGLGIDYAGIAGTGIGAMPTGIINTSAVGAVIGDTNGDEPTWGHVVKLWSEVAQDNADVGSLGFLTNSKVIGKLMETEKATGTANFICKNFPDKDGFTDIAGGRAGVSNQVPSNIEKGASGETLSAMIYGNFADLLIGMWGTLDIVVDSVSSNDGSVAVKTYQDVDVATRHPQSFAVFKDIKTD